VGAEKVAPVNGINFPDALSVASFAAKEGMPILLTKADVIPQSTMGAFTDLRVKETIVVGGSAVVSADVMTLLPEAVLIYGSERYETNIELANHFDVPNNHIYVATGMQYADALTGAVLAAKEDSAIVLVHHGLPESVETFITTNGIEQVTIFGGKATVSQKVEDKLSELIGD
jgi:bacillopeptidase F